MMLRKQAHARRKNNHSGHSSAVAATRGHHSGGHHSGGHGGGHAGGHFGGGGGGS